MVKQLTVLGSTGSIGVSTLDVVARHPDRYKVFALTANSNVDLLFEQCKQFQPEFAVMANPEKAQELETKLNATNLSITVLAETQGLCEVVAKDAVDYVMAAIVGAAGLLPTLEAAKHGKRVLLANKEALVMSGQLLLNAVTDSGAELLPIDSEHNAIFQCMPENYNGNLMSNGIDKILLTASGGPFRMKTLDELHNVTPDQACAHPNWDMGRKISVDSATMMNKGLELIEACWLFNCQPKDIQVVIHPESVIHSMVQYTDGSVLAQLGNPDMRTPIAHAMAWPERIPSGVDSLNLFDIAQLNFQAPDETRFVCLRLAKEAMEQGGTATTILNAANEIAVAEFLDGKLRFTEIANIVENTLSAMSIKAADSLEIILEADKLAREVSLEACNKAAA